jgi:hypothetical protein
VKTLHLTASAAMAVICLVSAGNQDVFLALAAWATSTLLLVAGLQPTEREKSLARTRRLDRW